MRTIWEQLHSSSGELANEKRKVVLMPLSSVGVNFRVARHPACEICDEVILAPKASGFGSSQWKVSSITI